MRNIQWYDENRVRLKFGLPEKRPGLKFYLEELQQSNWSPAFENLMRNRLIMGCLRYGKKLNDKSKSEYDLSHSIVRRAQLYQQTGNAEYLVDVANYALLEYEKKTHPLYHFSSIDDGEHSIKLT